MKNKAASLLSPSRYIQRIFDAVDERLKQRGFDVAGVQKAVVPASYVSGNLTIQQAYETATTLGAKTHKVGQVIGNRNAAVVAGDPILRETDNGGNRYPVLKLVDVGQGKTDSEYFMGLRPVAPGNTLLLSHDAEVNTNSATYVDTANKFQVTRPGLYRVKVELARSGGTAKARAIRKLKDGTVVVLTPEATQSTLTYPTFGAVQTLDMTIHVPWDDVIYIQMLNDSGPGQTAYMKNARLYYADATASMVPYDAAL